MKKLLINSIILASLVTCKISVAQDSTSVSLQFAIDNAVKHRDEIKIQQLNADNSMNEVSKAGSKLLPQLTSDIDMRYNGRLPTSIIPGDAFGAPGSPSRKVQFGTTYGTLAAFNLTVPVYNPSDFSDREIAKIQAAYDQMNVQKSEIDVKVDVTQTYFSGLIDKEKMSLARANMDKTLEVYMMSKAQLVKGAIMPNDLEKSRIDYENAKLDYKKSGNSYRLALKDLTYRMGIDTLKNPVLTDSLTNLYHQYHNVLNRDQQVHRIELKMQQTQEDIYQEDIKKQKKSYLPTVIVYGNFSDQNMNNSLTLFNHNYWYPYNYAGVKVSIPIFDGFLKERTKQGYKIQLESAKVNMDKLIRDYKYEVVSTQTSLINDKQDLENQLNNLKQAEDLYNTDEDRLKKGTIKPTDLAATYYTLQQTQNNYLNAIYTYLLDVVHY